MYIYLIIDEKLKPTGKGSGNDAYETYFKDKKYNLPNGIYNMHLTFDNGDGAYMDMGYHEVLVVADKTTIISGLVPKTVINFNLLI